eukprot:791699-Pelagomonas_calceolata.AAC.5
MRVLDGAVLSLTSSRVQRTHFMSNGARMSELEDGEGVNLTCKDLQGVRTVHHECYLCLWRA